MAKEKKMSDAIWVIFIWLMALALAWMSLLKFKILFHFIVKRILFGAALLLGTQLSSQDSTSRSITISGYAETYYQYDFNRPSDNKRPNFIYSHNRHNEFNLNLGFIKAGYEDKRIRASLALAAGTYMNANYAAEPGVLKNIFEGYAGLKLIEKKDFWVDLGIFGSHIGFESAISKDCWNLTRSILAENSPYFEAGARITYKTDNNKWMFRVLALNGWQRITRLNDHSLMNWGTQIQFKPSEKVVINYSNFFGSDKPDSVRLLRLFHNLYGIFSISEKVGLTFGLDIGTEEKLPGAGDNNSWFSPTAILRYLISAKWAIAVRGEYYSDENGVIVTTGSPRGFKTAGFSLNLDYNISKNMLVRMEARKLISKDKIFIKENALTESNTFITSSIALSF